AQMYPRVARQPGGSVMRVRGLDAFAPGDGETKILSDIDLEVHEGEIVGLYGLIGSGRTGLLTALFGAWPGRLRYDEFTVGGRPAVPASPKAMMRRGLGFLTEDR